MSEKSAVSRPREIKGWHVLAVALGAFGVILTANMAMVIAATGSFPGLVAKNSYVASQDFNARTAAQAKLGWSSRIDYAPGRLAVSVSGADGRPVDGLEVMVTVGRPSDARSDRVVALIWDGEAYAAVETLAAGVWRAELTARRGDGAEHVATARFTIR